MTLDKRRVVSAMKIKETQKGFYGCYWPLEGADSAIIAMLGDDCEDYMAKSAVKWL